jgi:hypothetical protein
MRITAQYNNVYCIGYYFHNRENNKKEYNTLCYAQYADSPSDVIA